MYFFKTWIENSISGLFSNNVSIPGVGVYPISIDFGSEYVLTAGIENNVIWDYASGWVSGGGGVSINLKMGTESINNINAEIIAERSVARVSPVISDIYSRAYWTNRYTERELYFHGAIYPTQEHFQQKSSPLANLNFTWATEGDMTNMETDRYARVWFSTGIGDELPSNVATTNIFDTIPFYGDSGFEEKGWFLNNTHWPLWLIKHDIEGTNMGFDYW